MAPSRKNSITGKSAVKKKSTVAPAKAAKATRAVHGKEAGKAIDAYVERCNPGLKDVVSAVRRLMKKTVPAAAEAINPWGIPTFEVNGPFCFMMAGKRHLTLGFAQGTSLLDPARLLEGTGKNIRHVKLTAVEQTNDPNLRNLVLEAAVLNGKALATSSMRTRAKS